MCEHIHDLCRKTPEPEMKSKEKRQTALRVYYTDTHRKLKINKSPIYKCRTCTQVICSSCIHDCDADEWFTHDTQLSILFYVLVFVRQFGCFMLHALC